MPDLTKIIILSAIFLGISVLVACDSKPSTMSKVLSAQEKIIVDYKIIDEGWRKALSTSNNLKKTAAVEKFNDFKRGLLSQPVVNFSCIVEQVISVSEMTCEDEKIKYRLLLKELEQNKMEKLKSFDKVVFSGRIVDVKPGFGSLWVGKENDSQRFESLFLTISEVIFNQPR